MAIPKAGLLPLYIEFYDIAVPDLRPRLELFLAKAAGALRAAGLEVVETGVCRVSREFAAAVARFEAENVDAIVTLHLAYSPSGESAAALAGTDIPVVVLNTTPDHLFDASTPPAAIMDNHGIHGVQDMCNLLLRNGKPFAVASGHLDHSDAAERAAGLCRAAAVARRLRRSRVGLMLAPFAGMNDFAVPHDSLRRNMGVEVVYCDAARQKERIAGVGEGEIDAEIADDLRRFRTRGPIDATLHRRSARVNLATRRWIEEERLTAFTVNFQDVTAASGLVTMPFLEADKAMARGIGYAGEGDVMTAAFVGALCAVYGKASFGEMFCPDWKNSAVFLSHMGEMNTDLAAGKPLLMEKDFPFSDCENPVVAYGRFMPGPVALVDLAPLSESDFRLIVAPGTMLDVEGEDRLEESIHGWFKPEMEVGDFLGAYASAGGTHHLALVYGDVEREMEALAEFMGWDYGLIR